MPKQAKFEIALLISLVILLASAILAYAAPSGPVITFISNETKQPSAARMINTTGGSITTVVLNATTQNPRWKAYVGNVTGALTLDDANDNTIFDWTLTNVIGEIYATRTSGNINWSGANCSNSTHISNEEFALNHTNRDDNITKTFNAQIHNGFYVGSRQILPNTCFSVHTYVNSTSQSTKFEETILYDGTNTSNGNIIYATPLEQDAYGFDNATYDFQMILPEVGLAAWASSTPYYFYVELT
ncbi:MAG: hypothetical protein AABX32_05570 [Nanoarchaeota archaeon]